MLAPAGKKEFVRREILRARTPRGCCIGFEDHTAAAETAPELIGDVSLDDEEVLRGPIPALRPQVRVARRIDQLRGDPDLIALALHRTFEHIADVQVPADLPHIDRLAFVDLSRIVSDDVHGAMARQVGDDVLRQAVGEPARRLVAAEVCKRQHRDRPPGGDAGAGVARPEMPGAHGQEKDQRRGRGRQDAAAGHVGPRTAIPTASSPLRVSLGPACQPRANRPGSDRRCS